MKTRVFKAASLLLTISLLIISLSFMASAVDNEFSEKWQLVTATPTVLMDGNNPQTVTIQLIVKEELTCYALAGAWDTVDSTGSIALTGDVAFNTTLPLNPNDYAYGAAAGGEMMWVNGKINSPVVLPQGYVFMTATYTVAANTASGTYKIAFAKTVYAGADAEPDETSEMLEIAIEVVGHTCTFHHYESDIDSHWQICACGKTIDNTDWDHTHDTYGKDDTQHWSICVCGAIVPDTTAPHDFTKGDCVCGAKKPATGLKGDVNLDGEITMEDAVALLRHVLNDLIITDATALSNGEVTGDTSLTMEDAVKIMRYALHDITSWD